MAEFSAGVDLEKFIETADITANGGPNQAARVRRVNIDGVLSSAGVAAAIAAHAAIAATEIISAHVELATETETKAGTDATRAITPATLNSLNDIQTIPAGGAAQTLDPNVYAAFLLTLTAAITLTITPPTAPGQHTITVYTIQDGTGGWAVTWPGSVDWDNNTPPSPSTAIGARTLYILTTLDGGTHWTGSMIGTALA